MSEPILLAASVRMSSAALKRWLQSPMPEADAFTDWPGEPKYLAAPEATATIDAVLQSLALDGLLGGDVRLLCQYDATNQLLQFGAYWVDGSTAASQAAAWQLLGAVRSLAAWRTSRELDTAGLWDASGLLVRVLLGKKTSSVDQDNTLIWPDWFADWLAADPLGAGLDTQLEWLLPVQAKALNKCLNRTAWLATPERPLSFDICFFTDGTHVLQTPSPSVLATEAQKQVQVLPNADPYTFRPLLNNMGCETFYADRSRIWFELAWVVCCLGPHGGQKLKIYRENADYTPLLQCGNTIWCPVLLPLGPESAFTLTAMGGMVVADLVYQTSGIVPVTVDGASFRALGDYAFADAQARYLYEEARGLVRQPLLPDAA